MIKLFIIIGIYIRICCSQLPDSLTVATHSGPVRGRLYENKSKFNHRSINAFIGIPYAKPPVGVNRFRSPQPLEVWSTEKDVSNNLVMCPQVYQRFNYELKQAIREDEDCLYLNIFVPITTRPNSGFPVMFYLHGGHFLFSGKDFYPPDYLLDNDVVLVTINYRLSVLGFLSTGDECCPGNFGLQDQIEALKWVSNNIRFFGGNPQNVTIFGHDSGAISISILLTSPRSWGLYQNVIISSGTVFTPNSVKIPDIYMALDFGRALNCDLNPMIAQNSLFANLSEKLIECLRSKSVDELMSASRLVGLYPNTFQFTFGPVIDSNTSNSVIVDQPITMFRSGNYWKTPLMVGLTLNEGSLDYFTYYDKMKDWALNEKIDYLFAKFNFKEFYSKVLSKSVNWFYFKRFNETNTPFDIRKQLQNNIQNNIFTQNNDWINREIEEQTLIDSIGDYMYGSANTLLLDIHSMNSKLTYLYVLEHRGLKTFGTLQKNGSQIIHRNQYGVTHMDDIFYLFPTLYSDNKTSTYDDPVIRNMCQYFTYFAKYGKFSQTNGILNYQMIGSYWTPYSPLNPYYMRFISSNPQIMRGFRTNYLNFWNYFVREIFDEMYAKRSNESQISAQFIGTVQLRGMIRFGDNRFVIN